MALLLFAVAASMVSRFGNPSARKPKNDGFRWARDTGATMVGQW